MRIGIVGAGLGGLLSGAYLAKKGHTVDIFENLPYPGGRFTNLDYKGYQLSTGALHMIPNGRRGPLGTLLAELDAGVDIIEPGKEGVFRVGDTDYVWDDLPKIYSLREKAKVLALIAKLKFGSGGNDTYRDFLKKNLDTPLTHRIADSFCGWAMSIDSSQILTRELVAITRNIYELGGPGIPRGGCKGVTDALVAVVEENGGSIHLEEVVEDIVVENGKAAGITTKNDSHDFDVIISNVGPKATISLCGEEHFDESYMGSIMKVQESAGIKISVGCDKPMIGRTPMLFTPDTRRIDGINEVTNFDPSLAPEGKHLLMSHQMLDPSRDPRKEIDIGIKDLHEMFPDFDDHCEILMAQTYHNGWPVNRSFSGQHMSPETPIDGLYNVGDGIKPAGWVETEGVAAGVRLAVDMVMKVQ